MRETYGGNTLDFFYDASGHPYALKYNGTTYYYITNLQGDVMYLIDANENTIASYEYDPYGNIVSATGTMAEINPLRYRGYYYDAELEMHYLQSRYYDPQIGRFINADSYASTGTGILGHNVFIYCNNNPIRFKDVSGHYPLEAAFDLLYTWLWGDGSTQYYGEKSRMAKILKKSSQMDDYIDAAIENFENGKSVTYGTAHFTSNDSMELYLSTQHCSYTITIRKETRERGFWWWRHTEYRYVASVVVHDTYNFDEFRDWKSFGSIMNNIAYIYSIFGGGHDYDWYASYTVYRRWQKA